MTKFYYIMMPDLIDASTAFALEDYLLTLPIFDNSRCFLAWRTPPTVMIGRYQNPWGEVHFDQLEKNNIQLIRRQTGGGAIFTDPGSIQFSFISSRQHRNSGEKQKQIDFKRFLTPVESALRELGYPVEMDQRNDLLIEGANSVAMLSTSTAIKCYITALLYNSDLDLMFNVLQPPAYKLESKGIQSARQRVMNLADYTKFDPSIIVYFQQFAVAAINKATLDGNILEAFHLSEADKIIRDIRHQKYLSKNWNFSNSPACTIKNEIKRDAGRVTSFIAIEEGKIQTINLEGDFFCQDNEQLARILDQDVGKIYDPSTMHRLTEELNQHKLIFGFDQDDLYTLFFPKETSAVE